LTRKKQERDRLLARVPLIQLAAHLVKQLVGGLNAQGKEESQESSVDNSPSKQEQGKQAFEHLLFLPSGK
jgi:hypothetical protein